MTITTITELKQEAYMMKDGEICTFPQWGNAKEAFSKGSHYMEYNYNNGIIIFYDEEREAYVIPFFEGIFEVILQNEWVYKKRHIQNNKNLIY